MCMLVAGCSGTSGPSLKWVVAMTSRVSEGELVRVPSGL